MAILTQLRPDGTPGKRYGTFAPKDAAAAVVEEEVDTFVGGGGGRFIGYKTLGEPIRLVRPWEDDPDLVPTPKPRRKRTRAELPRVRHPLRGRGVGTNSEVQARAWVPAIDLPTLRGSAAGLVGSVLINAVAPVVPVPGLDVTTRTVRGPDLESLQLLGLLGLI